MRFTIIDKTLFVETKRTKKKENAFFPFFPESTKKTRITIDRTCQVQVSDDIQKRKRLPTHLDYSHVEPCLLRELLADVTCGFGRGGEGGFQRLQLLGLDGGPRTSPLGPDLGLAARAAVGVIPSTVVVRGGGVASLPFGALRHAVLTVVAAAARSSTRCGAAVAISTSVPGHVGVAQRRTRRVHALRAGVQVLVRRLLLDARGTLEVALPVGRVLVVVREEVLGRHDTPGPAHERPCAQRFGSVVVEEGVVVVGESEERVLAVVRGRVAV